MTYGFRIKNNNGQTLVSDETYNLEFVGKAQYLGVTYILQEPFFKFDARLACLREVKFQINTGGRPVIPFLYNPNSGRTANRDAFGAISIMTLSGGVWTIYAWITNAASFNVPTIYCFCKMNPASLSGYGMAVFDAQGNQTYNTNARMIKLRSFVDVACPAGNPFNFNSGAYVGVSINTDDAITPVGMSFSKPALSFSVQNSAWRWRTVQISGHGYDITSYYNTSNQSIYTRWSEYIIRGPNLGNNNVPATNVTTLIIDGADFD